MRRSTSLGAWALAGLLVLGLATRSQIRAQSQPAAGSLQFEVASIKPGSGINGLRGGCRGIDSVYGAREIGSVPPLGRCVITDARLSHLIFIAYSVTNFRVKGAPEWVISGAERFTVEAEAEDPSKATEAQLLAMLQNLLADRFNLKFHWEEKDVPGFALMVAKRGPKLSESKSDNASTSFGSSVKPAPGQPVSLTARRYSMPMLANFLSGWSSQTGLTDAVIDRTGLVGEYDFQLSWDDDAGPVLSSALQEQLGLRLEAQKVPVSFFVFDSAQRPTAN